jgi:hypothetical protein
MYEALDSISRTEKKKKEREKRKRKRQRSACAFYSALKRELSL